MSTPTDWIQLCQTGLSNTTTTTTLTETPPITTTTTTSRDNTNNPPNPDQSRSSSSRPIRRRSRASRRNPTTLLNTDTTNFRAMVQQFTGGPTAHFAAGPQLPGAGPNFGFTQVAARPSGPHLQYPNQAMQQQQHMSSMMMNYNVHGGGVHAPPRPSSGDEDRSFGNYML